METTLNKQALIVWYYQCKKYTPIRISLVTNTDINEVKRVLRKNCCEYEMEERRKESASKLEKRQASFTRLYVGGSL